MCNSAREHYIRATAFEQPCSEEPDSQPKHLSAGDSRKLERTTQAWQDFANGWEQHEPWQAFTWGKRDAGIVETIPTSVLVNMLVGWCAPSRKG